MAQLRITRSEAYGVLIHAGDGKHIPVRIYFEFQQKQVDVGGGETIPGMTTIWGRLVPRAGDPNSIAFLEPDTSTLTIDDGRELKIILTGGGAFTAASGFQEKPVVPKAE